MFCRSYADLAGLPQVYGLYGAFVPCLVYGAFGSSRQLAVGPVAVTSMLLGTGLSNMFGDAIKNNGSPNNPVDPALQKQYDEAAVQVRRPSRDRLSGWVIGKVWLIVV